MENCCSVDAENIYRAYKFAEDISAVSRIGFIRRQLDSFFPIFIGKCFIILLIAPEPFMQSIELSLNELYESGVESGLPPYQLATAISKLYSTTLSIISMPERMSYLTAAIR